MTAFEQQCKCAESSSATGEGHLMSYLALRSCLPDLDPFSVAGSQLNPHCTRNTAKDTFDDDRTNMNALTASMRRPQPDAPTAAVYDGNTFLGQESLFPVPPLLHQPPSAEESRVRRASGRTVA